MPEFDIALGIFILFLAIVMWRVEQVYWAWLAFWLAGTFYICWGIVKATKDR